MYLGPIHPTLPGLGTGHNPVKPIKLSSTTGKQVVLFDQEYTFGLQPQPVAIDAQTVVYESSAANALLRLTQILELSQNSEWQRCGMFVQWREDGVNDPEDGWYIIKSADISEEFLFSAYAEPTISLELRARQRSSIGISVESKAVKNDANLAGVTLAALPMGMSTQYPAATWTFAGANGNILVVENAPSILRASLTTPVTVMTQGRCRVSDQTVNRSAQTEVFWKDHRNINGNWEISNDLVRYYFAEGASAPSIDVWDGFSAAWVNLGQYQLQVTNTGPVLPLQTVKFQTISPEEVVWTEWRFDALGTALVVVTNRMRRGSKLIESQLVAASGAGLTGSQSIAIANVTSFQVQVSSADGTGVVGHSVLLADGFETAGAPQVVFRSIGTDATGTLNWWALTASPTIASNVVTMPTNSRMVTGHPDWTDCTAQIRFQFATGNKPRFSFHFTDPSDQIFALLDGTNLTLYKAIAGANTSIQTVANVTLVNATSYWIQLTATGTSYTAKVFADNAGAINLGSQIGSSVSGIISDPILQSGQIAVSNVDAGTGTQTLGGAFGHVCEVSAAMPASWSPNNPWTTNELAYAQSKAQAFSGSASFSIYAAAALSGSMESITSNSITEGASTVFSYSFAYRVSAAVSITLTDNIIGGPSVVAAAPFNAWKVVTGTVNSGAGGARTMGLTVSGNAGACLIYIDALAVYQSPAVFGFAYLTANPFAPSAAAPASLCSGATVPAGTVTRIAIICGTVDGQYTSLGTAALYAARWASYNRQRVKERIAVGLVA